MSDLNYTLCLASWGVNASVALGSSASVIPVTGAISLRQGWFPLENDNRTWFQFNVYVTGGTPAPSNLQLSVWDKDANLQVFGPVNATNPGSQWYFSWSRGPIANLPATDARFELRYSGTKTGMAWWGASVFAYRRQNP